MSLTDADIDIALLLGCLEGNGPDDVRLTREQANQLRAHVIAQRRELERLRLSEASCTGKHTPLKVLEPDEFCPACVAIEERDYFERELENARRGEQWREFGCCAALTAFANALDPTGEHDAFADVFNFIAALPGWSDFGEEDGDWC